METSNPSDKIGQCNYQQAGTTYDNLPEKILPCNGFKSAKPRAILTSEQVIAIFQLKLRPALPKPCASAVARAYGISEKAIRDIWKGRTWFEETSRFEPTRPAREVGPPGRPKGRKDSTPRRRRQSTAGLRPPDDGDESFSDPDAAASFQGRARSERSNTRGDGNSGNVLQMWDRVAASTPCLPRMPLTAGADPTHGASGGCSAPPSVFSYPALRSGVSLPQARFSVDPAPAALSAAAAGLGMCWLLPNALPMAAAAAADWLHPHQAWLPPPPGTVYCGGGAAAWPPAYPHLGCAAAIPPPHLRLAAALLLGQLGRGDGAAALGRGPPWMPCGYGGGHDARRVQGPA
jgi:hypothetical protein